MNLDPAKLEEAITPKTRGIVAVHLYGWPAEMDAIREIADRRGLFVLEDAAEALGARYKGRPAGALGHAAIFSFYGNKIITTGEGGMVVTAMQEVADEARLLRGQAMDPQRRYWFGRVGYNYRLTNMQAAVGLGQIERLDRHLAMRVEIAEKYRALLEPFGDLLEIPSPPAHVNHAYWMYVVALREEVGAERDRVAQIMDERGVETRPVFPPLHRLPPYLDHGRPFPVADSVSRRGLNLPTWGGLTAEDIERVAGTLVGACREAASEAARVGAR
jgi:perosamine synthetase